MLFCINIKPYEQYHKKRQHLVKYSSFYSCKDIIYFYLFSCGFVFLHSKLVNAQCIYENEKYNRIYVLTMINKKKQIYIPKHSFASIQTTIATLADMAFRDENKKILPESIINEKCRLC